MPIGLTDPPQHLSARGGLDVDQRTTDDYGAEVKLFFIVHRPALLLFGQCGVGESTKTDGLHAYQPFACEAHRNDCSLFLHDHKRRTCNFTDQLPRSVIMAARYAFCLR